MKTLARCSGVSLSEYTLSASLVGVLVLSSLGLMNDGLLEQFLGINGWMSEVKAVVTTGPSVSEQAAALQEPAEQQPTTPTTNSSSSSNPLNDVASTNADLSVYLQQVDTSQLVEVSGEYGNTLELYEEALSNLELAVSLESQAATDPAAMDLVYHAKRLAMMQLFLAQDIVKHYEAQYGGGYTENGLNEYGKLVQTIALEIGDPHIYDYVQSVSKGYDPSMIFPDLDAQAEQFNTAYNNFLASGNNGLDSTSYDTIATTGGEMSENAYDTSQENALNSYEGAQTIEDCMDGC